MTAAVAASPVVTPEALQRIPLPELYESPLNPRTQYDDKALEELAGSLLASGQLTPIIVRPRQGGGYELAAGHRRRRAAMLACKKSPEGAKYRGLDALLAVVRPLSEKEFIEVLNIENLQRDDLHPLEEATGFRDLMQKAGYDVAKIAARIGRSTRYVYDSLTLLKLTSQAKALFMAGTFERGHAILLARLSPTDQGRALGDLKEVAQGSDIDSLLLEPDGGAEDEDELPLHDQVKPVSVREFQKAIQRSIRATPDHVDPFLFPESAAALEAAKEETLSVIHITREYLASDEVRHADEKQRVFGSQAWQRADGKPEEDERTGKPVKSKECDWSRYGFVVSGRGQGEVFRVCINKQKCKTHWPEHVKRAEQAKKRAKTGTAAPAKDKTPKAEPWEVREAQRRREEEARAAEHKRWKAAVPAILKAVAAKISKTAAGPTSGLADEVLTRCTERGKPNTLVPRGKTLEDLIRHAAFQLYVEDVGDLAPGWYQHDNAVKNLKTLGIDPAKIVDEVAPKPKAEKPAAKKAAKKKGGK